MTTDERVAALQRIPLFAELSDNELRVLTWSMRDEQVASGQEICREGDESGPFYVIVEGEAKLIVGNRYRRMLGPGDYFGEMSLFDAGRRAGTVRATTEVRALSLTREGFLAALEENWAVTKKILAELSGRIRQMDRSVI